MYYLLVLALLFAYSMPANAQSRINIKLKWTPVWEYTDETPADASLLAHYTVYVCEAPIVAGGPDGDNPQMEAPVCMRQLETFNVMETTAQQNYTVKDVQGTLYIRNSVMLKTGVESRLSNEVSVPYSTRQLKAPVLELVFTAPAVESP